MINLKVIYLNILTGLGKSCDLTQWTQQNTWSVWWPHKLHLHIVWPSTWNPCGIIWNNMESIWNNVESMWKNVESIQNNMESMWNNVESMWNNVESMWNNVESIWNNMESMEGIVMDSMFIPSGFQRDIPWNIQIPWSFHMEWIWKHTPKWLGPQPNNSIWNRWNPHGNDMDSTWNPPGMWGHSKDLQLCIAAHSVTDD